MRKTFLYLIFIFIGGSALQTFADNTEVDLSIDYKEVVWILVTPVAIRPCLTTMMR